MTKILNMHVSTGYLLRKDTVSESLGWCQINYASHPLINSQSSAQHLREVIMRARAGGWLRIRGGKVYIKLFI